MGVNGDFIWVFSWAIALLSILAGLRLFSPAVLIVASASWLLIKAVISLKSPLVISSTDFSTPFVVSFGLGALLISQAAYGYRRISILRGNSSFRVGLFLYWG